MRYEDYTALDFIQDDFFIKWVLHEDEEAGLFWKKWMEINPHKREELLVAKEFINRVSYEKPLSMPEKDFTRIHENLIRFSDQHAIREQGRWNIRVSVISWSVAASVLIFVFSMLIFIKRENTPTAEVAIEMQSIITPKAGRRPVKLPDGTMVKLNGNSKINFPREFKSDYREIWLEGEAFFEVVSDSTKPFIIRSEDFTVEVVGTSFNYRAIGSEHQKKVAVVSGKVKVKSPGLEPLLLTPDLMAVYDSKTKGLVAMKFDVKSVTSWKDGILYFNRMPLRAVFNQLENWYDVHIEVSPEISLKDIYSGEYQNETLQNVLYGIGYTSGFDYSINGKQVTIYKNGNE
ncbi:MAG: FecR domain-containing protein [Cyclobacteriaceae bacterium]|nr:FecR domain-containing protein [Cyclobacteriaceae bacterium]